MSLMQTTKPVTGKERISLGEILRAGAERLNGASDSPRLDCELLLAHALGIDRAALYARSADTLDSESARRLEELLSERARGRPVAQIIGRKEFYSLKFEITPEVLTPRPETELLVEVVSGSLGAADRQVQCLDLGTGCGALAIALARLMPRWRILATDVSPAALKVARRNAGRLTPGRIHFAGGSWYEPLDEERKFDAIVSNPPYVESELCVRGPLRFEPRGALDGGPDGLRQLREVISGAPQRLRRGGMLAVEHGARQGEAVRRLMTDADLGKPVTHRDLAGHERVTAARARGWERGHPALGEGRMPSFPGGMSSLAAGSG